MSYVRLMLCLAFGLTGLCIVMKTLFESLLADWDMVEAWRTFFRRPRFSQARWSAE